MKKIAMILACVMIYIQLPANNLPVSLNVTAPSGLKLRAQPGMDSEVLSIIPHKAVVSVIENETTMSVADEINYLEGKWIFVEFEGEEGYVFDGFLSNLPIPELSFEKTQFDLDFIYPLQSWMDYRKMNSAKLDTFSSSTYTKVLTKYVDGASMERKNTTKYYQVKTFLPKAKISDAYYLLYNMLSTDSEKASFKQKSIYITNREGKVDKINIDLDIPVTIKQGKDGVSIQIRSYEQGCTF